MFDESDVIHTYTRDEAIQDGTLLEIPVNTLAKEYGIKYHCAMTLGLFSAINPANDGTDKLGQDLEGRVWDMLTMFKLAVRTRRKLSISGSEIRFTFLVARDPNRAENIAVKAVCGPGDHGEPVITFMLPEED